jgi:hypothetical protein
MHPLMLAGASSVLAGSLGQIVAHRSSVKQAVSAKRNIRVGPSVSSFAMKRDEEKARAVWLRYLRHEAL